MTSTNNDQDRKKQLPHAQSLRVTPQHSQNKEYYHPRNLSDGEFVIIEEVKAPVLSPETNCQSNGFNSSNNQHGQNQQPDRGRPGNAAQRASTSTGVGMSQPQFHVGKSSLSNDSDFEIINSPEKVIQKDDLARSKHNKAERRLLDSSKVKNIPKMNSSSDLDKDRDGFSNAVAEAKEKMGSKPTKNGNNGIFGCFFCCGPKNNASAGHVRKRPIPKPEKRPQNGDDHRKEQTKNGFKSPNGSMKNSSPRGTFKPTSGDQNLFSPNTAYNDDSREERKEGQMNAVSQNTSKILDQDGCLYGIPRVPPSTGKSKSAMTGKKNDKENQEPGELDIDAIEIDVMDERVSANALQSMRKYAKLGVSESEVLDSIGDEVIEDERNNSHDKKINYSSITRAGAVKEQTTANFPLTTNPKEPKVSHSSSGVSSIKMTQQMSQKELQPNYSKRSLASDYKNVTMLQVTEETILMVNKPGGIQQNENIIISPERVKQGSRTNKGQSAQTEMENGLFFLRPEKSETPNLGNDYMNTPGSDSNDSRRRRSRNVSARTPHIQLPHDSNTENVSGQRLSEFNVNSKSVVSFHKTRIPSSIEEEKQVNNVEDDQIDGKLSVPVSGFDNKMVIDQRQQEQTTAPDNSAIGMNKSTAISANLSQPQKINSEVYSQADISATGISQNVGSRSNEARQGSKSPNASKIPPVSNKTRTASHIEQDNLTTVQENPTLPGSMYGTEGINYTESGQHTIAGTPYSVQIQMYSSLLHTRQKDYDQIQRQLTKLKVQAQQAKRRFNKIQKDLKNVDQDNLDIQLQLNTLLKSKLMQNSIK